MKKIFLLYLFTFMSGTFSFAQNVSINAGGSLPNSSAMLDVSSTAKGFLLPRMNMEQRNLIALPANGLLIYQTDDIIGLYVNKGTSEAPNWLLVGPAITTSPAILFATDQSVANNSYVGLGTSSSAFIRQTIVVPADCVLRSIVFSIRSNSPGPYTAIVYRQPQGSFVPTPTSLSATISNGAITNTGFGVGAVVVNAGDLISVQLSGSTLSNGVAISVTYQ